MRAYLAGLDVGEPEGELSWREVGHRALEELQPSQRYRGFEVVRIAGQPLLFSEELNRLLSEPRIPLSFEQQAFRLRGAEAECAGFILRRRLKAEEKLSNAVKVRLASDLTPHAVRFRLPAVIQPSDRFAGLCTNEIATGEIRRAGQGGLVLSGRDLLARGEVIRDLWASRCANHIGVSLLAFTRDGYAVLVRKARHAANVPDRLSASGSGSIDWADYRRLGTLLLETLVLRAMKRELAERTGISPELIADVALIGYARVLFRGGKPQFFGTARLDLEAGEIRARDTKDDLVAGFVMAKLDPSSRDALDRGLAQLAAERRKSLSASLAALLELLRLQLRSKGAEILELLGRP